MWHLIGSPGGYSLEGNLHLKTCLFGPPKLRHSNTLAHFGGTLPTQPIQHRRHMLRCSFRVISMAGKGRMTRVEIHLCLLPKMNQQSPLLWPITTGLLT